MTATIRAVRVFALVALASLTLVAAGCGGSASLRSDPASANLGSAAAKLVPADAEAFVSLDTDRSSTQWQRLDQLTFEQLTFGQLTFGHEQARRRRGVAAPLGDKCRGPAPRAGLSSRPYCLL